MRLIGNNGLRRQIPSITIKNKTLKTVVTGRLSRQKRQPTDPLSKVGESDGCTFQIKYS